MMRKKLLALLLVVSMMVLPTGCGLSGKETTPPPTTPTPTPTTEAQTAEESNANSQEKAYDSTNDSSYLSQYFNINLKDNITDVATFTDGLKKLVGDNEDAPKFSTSDEGNPTIAIDGKLTGLKAIKAGVIAANFGELALTYPEEKTVNCLKENQIDIEPDNEYGAYLACAIDTELITPKEAAVYAMDEDVTKDETAKLFMKIASANGLARNFLGYSSDEDIYGKLDNAWNSFIMMDDKKLSEIGKNAVQQGITTGYNLKSDAYNARFLPELTLQYGHSVIKHAHQLIGLLNSEGIVAKVQLEPKTSVYEYLLEWGPIPEATPIYEVKQYDDLYLVNAVEYDLELEFENKEDMLAFDELVQAYAKKNEGNEEAKGLLASSWWQPLYSTTMEDMPKDAYDQIYDCIITDENYSFHSFCLPTDLDKVTKDLGKLSDGLEIKPVKRYCNLAFYNYLTGDDYQ